ncbi:NAD(P)H-dependent oxidoreductase [Saccharospirillum mangrovi]|uniref:NAD(P)H-dependent oxidoreductase n=1 Tax=Saccharospirillum mangrovi TaxID=2161747 RepID=UPI000D3D732A|nr:NAD(P)H-dependent oxidoreductase [Saccharospirillum mangrovi]
MTHIGIVYFSAGRSLELLANDLAGGVESVQNCQAILLPVEGRHILEGRYKNEALFEQLDAVDGIAFGSPTYMGGPAAQFKAFADATSGERYTEQRWAGKVAAGFTVGGSENGDQSATLGYFNILASQLGMVWVNLAVASKYNAAGLNRLGSQQGVVAQADAGQVHPDDRATAHYLGAHLSQLAQRLTSTADVTTPNAARFPAALT